MLARTVQSQGRAENNGSEYEFGDAQNAVMASLSRSMRFVAMAYVVCGSLGGAAALLVFSDSVFYGLVCASVAVITVFQGLWLWSAAASFRRVVETRSSDVGNLMGAISDLRKYYLVMAISGVCLAVSDIAAFVHRSHSPQNQQTQVSEPAPESSDRAPSP